MAKKLMVEITDEMLDRYWEAYDKAVALGKRPSVKYNPASNYYLECWALGYDGKWFEIEPALPDEIGFARRVRGEWYIYAPVDWDWCMELRYKVNPKVARHFGLTYAKKTTK